MKHCVYGLGGGSNFDPGPSVPSTLGLDMRTTPSWQQCGLVKQAFRDLAQSLPGCPNVHWPVLGGSSSGP